MLIKIALRALLRRKGLAAVGLAAVLLAAAMVSALGNLSLDLEGKVRQELSAYGANLIILPKGASFQTGVAGMDFGSVSEDRYLPPSALATLEELRTQGRISGLAPFLYAVVLVQRQPVVLVGTQFQRAQEISPWWSLRGRLPQGEEVLLGANVAQRLALGPGDRLDLEYRQRRLPLTVVGVLESGDSEDDQLLARLELVQEIVGQGPMLDVIQARATSIEEVVAQLREVLPEAEVRPVRQITQAEASVQGRVQLLMLLVAGFIAFAAGLALLSTMTAAVLQRTVEIGLMKALGAGGGRIAALILAEGLAISLFGGLFGGILGFGIAQLIGRSVFATEIAFHPQAWLLAVLTAVILGVLAVILPLRRALAIDPALTLRGE